MTYGTYRDFKRILFVVMYVFCVSVVGSRTVDVHVAQLRAKLGDDSPIRTVRGVGYSAEVSGDE